MTGVRFHEIGLRAEIASPGRRFVHEGGCVFHAGTIGQNTFKVHSANYQRSPNRMTSRISFLLES